MPDLLALNMSPKESMDLLTARHPNIEGRVSMESDTYPGEIRKRQEGEE